jgi:hypothetical protein
MKTLNQIREEGITVLTESLGSVDTIRFLQQFDAGHGDYTAERRRILGNPTIDNVLKKIMARRKRHAVHR